MDLKLKLPLETSLNAIVLGVTSTLLLPIIIAYLWEKWFSDVSSVPRGYYKLGMKAPSNFADEADPKYAYKDAETNGHATGTATNTKWKVKALMIHPIKSCRGIEVTSAAVDGAGFLWDRKFAVAEWMASKKDKNVKVWTFRTLRQPGYERLAKVKPEIWLRNSMTEVLSQHADADGFMVVKYPYVPSGPFAWLYKIFAGLGVLGGETSFRVPLVPPKDHKYPVEDVTIWKDQPQWLNYGVHVPDSFRRYLNAKNPVTLFRVDPQIYREVYRNAPRKEELGYQAIVGFADSYPLHMLNLASVRDVAEKVQAAIPDFTARRFRANILVTGGGKYDEDAWKFVKIGKHKMHCACHTIRCKLPNVDPDTAVRHDVEPDKTLRSFRCIDPGAPLGAALGLQLVPESDSVIELKVGDEVEVLERGEHHYVTM
jgi:uncharacterized protein YcbX